MNIYPAIDIKAGECVRLYQGRYDQVTVYQKNPVALAKSFAQQGANILHVIDLDGAKQGKSINLDKIVEIVRQTQLKIQMGGGIRNKQQITDLLAQGIYRVILGSIAISQPDPVKQWLQEFGGDRIVLALDIRANEHNEPKLALHGWETPSEKTLWQLLDEYRSSPLKHVLCTDIHRDGTLEGPNIDLYKECVKRYPDLQFQASGGISALEDLRELGKIPVSGVVIGKAIYENKFSLATVFNEIRV